jgi:ketosteroid isomerase-like protein
VFSEKALRAYETAWSSGDSNAVASLYSPDAIRHDPLFGGDQNGPSAIKDFAAKFFSWYPSVRLERLYSFGMVSGNPIKTGGVYAIHATDQAGRPCDVQAIVQLDAPEDKITNESVYYKADSLIACGWAR